MLASLRLAGAVFVGTLLGAGVLTAALPPLPEYFLAEQILLAQGGACLLALPVAVVWALIARRKAAAAGADDARAWRALLVGVALGSVEFWNTLFEWVGETERPFSAWAALPALLLALCAFWIAPRLAGRRGALRAAGLAGLALAVVAALIGPVDTWVSGERLAPVPARVEVESPAPAPTDAVDVVLVSIDTLRADAVYGPQSAQVPTLDALRTAGTWAEYARSSSNCTVPGHAGMLTGMGALEHRVWENFQSFPDAPPVLSASYRDAGYRTLAVISNAILLDGTGFERGFDAYDDALVADNASRFLFLREAQRGSLASALLPRGLFRRAFEKVFFRGQHPHAVLAAEQAEGARTTRRALAWLDALYADDAPFFFFLHYMDPHAPYSAPQGFRGRHSDAETDARSRGRYLEEVEFVDHCLGRVVERLDASGRPYVLLVTSDHGEHLGEHGLYGHTNSGYEPLIRVPFLLKGPGIAADRRIEPPHLADLAPTLLRYSGLAVPEAMVGTDLLGSQVPPAQTRLHFARESRALGVKHGPWKWVVIDMEHGLPPATDELAGMGEFFHLGEDPSESEPRDRNELPAGWLENVLSIYHAAEPPLLGDETGNNMAKRLAALEALGYVKGEEPDAPKPLPTRDQQVD